MYPISFAFFHYSGSGGSLETIGLERIVCIANALTCIIAMRCVTKQSRSRQHYNSRDP